MISVNNMESLLAFSIHATPLSFYDFRGQIPFLRFLFVFLRILSLHIPRNSCSILYFRELYIMDQIQIVQKAHIDQKDVIYMKIERVSDTQRDS